MTTVYISIGNSDDKLTQADWSRFVHLVDELLDSRLISVHGRWFSSPRSPYQNACWCIEKEKEPILRRELGDLARQFRQDSIAWAEAPTTDFIGPAVTP